VKAFKRYEPFLIATIFGVIYLFIKAHQYAAFETAFEPADYELMIWNVIHGNGLTTAYPVHSFLGEHFSPILFLLVPVYALFSSVWVLTVFQCALLAAAAVPLYYLASKLTGSRMVSILLSLCYLVSPLTVNALMYDFHPETLYPVIFFSALLMYEKKEWRWFFGVLALAVMVKEDAFIALVGMGIYILWHGERHKGLGLALASALGFVVVMLALMPMFRDGGYLFVNRWDGYGQSGSEIAQNFLNPVRHAEVILTGPKLSRMNELFSPYFYLPLFAPAAFVFLALPNLFVLYSSDYWMMNGPFLYYAALSIPFLFYASIKGMKFLGGLRPQYSGKILLLLAVLMLTVHAGKSSLFLEASKALRPIPPRCGVAKGVIRLIPSGAAVAASSAMVPHLDLHPSRSYFPLGASGAEYILLDLEGNPWPMSSEKLSYSADTLKASRYWERVSERENILLFRRSTR